MGPVTAVNPDRESAKDRAAVKIRFGLSRNSWNLRKSGGVRLDNTVHVIQQCLILKQRFFVLF